MQPNKPAVHHAIKPAPEELSRRGLLRVVTNVPEGREVILPPGALTRYFGPELVRRLAQRKQEVRHVAD